MQENRPAGVEAGLERMVSEFPSYTRREFEVDRVVHLVGVPAALGAVAWLLAALLREGTGLQLLAGVIYSLGLLGMLVASAAYNMTPVGRAKFVLRRLDHAMIFAMIAGSYTPFALCALPPRLGVPLFVGAWAVAVVGGALKMRFGTRYGRAFLTLYLAHGWMLVLVLGPVIEALQGQTMALLLSGGVVYCIGTFVYTRERWLFHNAAWHVLVLAAAGLQLGAIAQVLLPGAL